MFGRFFDHLLDELRGAITRQPRVPAALAGVAGGMECISEGQRAEHEGRLADALECFESALEAFPDSAELHAMHGNVLRTLGRNDDAIAAYRTACELKPALAAAWYNLALTEHQSGEIDAAEQHYRVALDLDPASARVHSSLLCLVGMGYAGGRARAPQQVLSEHVAWARRHAEALRDAWQAHTNKPDPAKRLTIGYVSADLRQHAIACFVEPLLSAHDRTQFKVICYDNSTVEDAMKSRLRALADGWRNIAADDDDAVARQIREDGVDILIDLGGHTQGNRLLVFARRPAPVQVTYLGYPNSTGLTAMDYRLTDVHADPPGLTEAHYSERLLRLPNCMWCYRPFAEMPEPAPREVGQDGVTFGSMNSCVKLNPELFALWARLLRETPGSRLLLAAVPAGSAQQRVHASFAALGIAADRIECAPWLNNAGFWNLHQRVDVALDTSPMNGGTTTCETLWMGVPVVTLAGDTFAARAGESLLTAAGFSEWVATTPDQYVQIVRNLALDGGRRAELRRGMRGRIVDSKLMDAAGFARDLERLYREAWQAWCKAPR